MIKNKICRLCTKELPMVYFTSPQAKYCNPCRLIHKLELRNAMTLRSLERSKTKKQKTVGIIRISDLKKVAQKVVNKYIRQRDKDLPCISCGKICGDFDAGHFISQGSSGALRYNEDNIHAQGTGCNRYKHGNLLEYRINLVKKIGFEKVEWLEEHRHDVKKWSREELDKIIDKYKSMLR